ncbi:hypothetical protein [Streptomyces sp. MST-110588]|nr:hypothetical protein [Streptomyces sp. MST-110588]UNO39613.1 hypothetical protein KGS77_08345 [Streptomyces sp. MST-110588]
MGIDDLTGVVWAADHRPRSKDELDAVIGQVLAWVDSRAEMPSWART